MLSHYRRQALYVTLVMVVWIVSFELNETLFAVAQYSIVANLIFLPAMLRPLAVLLFGPAGVLGLFLGAVVTFPMSSLDTASLIAVCAASSIPAWLAIQLVHKMPSFSYQLGNELAGLELKTILVIAVLSAALSASAHYYAFWFVPQTDHSFEQLVSMFIGDTIGSLIVLYLISAGLRLLTRLHTDSMKSQ